MHNRAPGRNNTTGFKGVYLVRSTGRFKASIRLAGKHTYLGTFDTKEEASKAYEEAANDHWGEFALHRSRA